MPVADKTDADALCHAARDIARHIAGLAEEISSLRHMTRGENKTVIDRELIKLKDQVTLLGAVVEDLERAQHAGAAI